MKNSSRTVLRAWQSAHQGETRRRRRALTFIEIMVATVIMVAAFFPLVSMMRSGARRAKFQKIRAFATSMAQNLLERMRGMSIYYLEFDTGQNWYKRAEVLGHGHLEDDLADLIENDAIFLPQVGSEGVPDDDEMKDLVERWHKRRELFDYKPHVVSSNASWDPELAKRKMAILAVSVSWNQEFKRLDNLQALKDDLANGTLQGPNALTLFAIVGEGLFHAASEAEAPAAGP